MTIKTKINKIYIQEVFWLVFVLAVSWAIIAARPNNAGVPISSKTDTYGNISSTREPSAKP